MSSNLFYLVFGLLIVVFHLSFSPFFFGVLRGVFVLGAPLGSDVGGQPARSIYLRFAH